jgi:hypothetical protein
MPGSDVNIGVFILGVSVISGVSTAKTGPGDEFQQNQF